MQRTHKVSRLLEARVFCVGRRVGEWRKEGEGSVSGSWESRIQH